MKKFLVLSVASVAMFGVNAFAGSGDSLTQGVDFNRSGVQSSLAQNICAQTPGAVNHVIYYEFNKAQSAETMSTLQNIANICSGAGSCSNMTLTGHTDTTGAASYNQALSVRRANRVRSELVRLGMSSGSMTTLGRGETELFVPTANGVKERLNRRVEVCFNQAVIEYSEPVYQEPVYQEPVYQEPVYQEPVYVEPAPVAAEPVYVEPTPAPYVEPAPVYTPAPAPMPAPAPVASGFPGGLLALGAVGAIGLIAIIADDSPSSP